MLKAELKRYAEVTSKTEGKYANSSVNMTYEFLLFTLKC